MLFPLLIFLFGLVVLYYGAEWLIRGAVALALQHGIRPLVVGLTVVALGTSMPEFVVNFFAAMSREDNLALGNIVGSNICNIALILGLSALVLPMAVEPSTVRREYPLMLGVMVVFYVFAMDGVISQFEGFVLLSGLGGFLIYLTIEARRHRSRERAEEVLEVNDDELHISGWKKTMFIVVGTIFLALGARLMVYSAIEIAEMLGIDPVVVGLTVVAIGTSLPELATSVVGAFKREADMSVGNVLGSNLLNVLFVVGLISVFHPLQVDTTIINTHFPVMLGFSVLLFPIVWTHYKISRFEGAILLATFTAYMLYVILPHL
jgi:cation:H+ antiporter